MKGLGVTFFSQGHPPELDIPNVQTSNLATYKHFVI